MLPEPEFSVQHPYDRHNLAGTSVDDDASHFEESVKETRVEVVANNESFEVEQPADVAFNNPPQSVATDFAAPCTQIVLLRPGGYWGQASQLVQLAKCPAKNLVLHFGSVWDDIGRFIDPSLNERSCVLPCETSRFLRFCKSLK